MWDQPTTDKLIELKEEGKTMSAIATILDITKNMVAGRLHRLGLCAPRGGIPDYRGHGHRAMEASPTNGCMWPYGDPQKEGFRFCGGMRADGWSYCANHVTRAYRVIDGNDVSSEAAE